MKWVTPWRTDVPAFFRALRDGNGTAAGTIVGLRFGDGEETVINLDMIDSRREEFPGRESRDVLLPQGHVTDPDPENEPGVDGIESWFLKFETDASDDGRVIARGSYYDAYEMDYQVTDLRTVKAVREGENDYD